MPTLSHTVRHLRARLRHAALLAALAMGVGAATFTPSTAEAASPYLIVPPDGQAEASPAYVYANMSNEQALAELERREILFTKLDDVSGVRAPVRLTGKLHGVHIHSALPPEKRVESPFEILDARLALALDDFCAQLAKRDIVEVVHYTMYRPNVGSPTPHTHASNDKPSAPTHTHASNETSKGGASKPQQAAPQKPKSAHATKAEQPRERKRTTAKHKLGKGGKDDARPDAKTSKSKEKPAKRPPPPPKVVKAAPPGTRHPAGLAIDVGALIKKDGTTVSVASHFNGQVGQQTCGLGAPDANASRAVELREIVCGALETGIFTYVLTPNYDAAHADHFHMEIKPGVKWFLYH